LKRAIKKIAVQRGLDDITIVIQGNGPLTYRLTPVDTQRLSLDLPNVVSAIRFQLLPVDHQLLKQIRIGQHPKKLRLVFDLNHPIDKGLQYAIKVVGDQLAMRLSLVVAHAP
jgi:AMIN domain